ncbi:MAG TPA: type IX secretion system membrane protein PorP/SprF [Bacteroidales bacterium]|nr:type IX secretion system membrane protein PorP/SprF [Bacteroidales bacterium]
MKKTAVAFLFFILTLQSVFPQQDPLSSHYMFNTMAYNPGVAGMSGKICATALNRQQWVGFDGAPVTTVFSVNAPVAPFKIKSGVGLLVESDNIGYNKDILLSGSYSYHMDLGQGKLGIGLSMGMLNKKLNPEWNIPAGDAFTPASGDPLIPDNEESCVIFDAGLGLYYNTDKYYAAFSVTHINKPEIKFTEGSSYVSRHYYLTAGYTLQLPNPSLELLPSVLALSDGTVTQFTISSLIRYNKKVWGGVSYRAGDAFIGIVGFELLNGIRLGYAYDFTVSDVRKTSNGSHELMINYCFDLNLGKSPMKYKSIRFL